MRKSTCLKMAVLTSVMLLNSVFANAEASQAKSVLAWLSLVDGGHYAQSWDKAAPFFKEQVSQVQWQDGLKSARSPLGKLLERNIERSSIHSELPGAPKGEYIVVFLKASFEKKSPATETVTLQKVGEQWLVVGYYIQ